VLLVSETTESKLVRVGGDLRREFPHVPEERIAIVLHDVTVELVARARFHDFVPLLVHRAARESLVANPGAAASE